VQYTWVHAYKWTLLTPTVRMGQYSGRKSRTLELLRYRAIHLIARLETNPATAKHLHDPARCRNGVHFRFVESEKFSIRCSHTCQHACFKSFEFRSERNRFLKGPKLTMFDAHVWEGLYLSWHVWFKGSFVEGDLRAEDLEFVHYR